VLVLVLVLVLLREPIQPNGRRPALARISHTLFSQSADLPSGREGEGLDRRRRDDLIAALAVSGPCLARSRVRMPRRCSIVGAQFLEVVAF
jgi:hypothetical protein